MFALKKTITPFILPPGIFILAIMFIALEAAETSLKTKGRR